MKRLLAASVIVFFVGATADVMAASCTGTQITNKNDIEPTLRNKRVNAVAPGGGETWNEDHCANGDLYKVGDGTAVDPRAKRGTWGAGLQDGINTTVQYTYTGDTTYNWSLFVTNGGGFCWGNPNNNHEVIATDPNPLTLPCP